MFKNSSPKIWQPQLYKRLQVDNYCLSLFSKRWWIPLFWTAILMRDLVWVNTYINTFFIIYIIKEYYRCSYGPLLWSISWIGWVTPDSTFKRYADNLIFSVRSKFETFLQTRFFSVSEFSGYRLENSTWRLYLYSRGPSLHSLMSLYICKYHYPSTCYVDPLCQYCCPLHPDFLAHVYVFMSLLDFKLLPDCRINSPSKQSILIYYKVLEFKRSYVPYFAKATYQGLLLELLIILTLLYNAFKNNQLKF